jgi:methane/ammonia monooxygenase subunit B
MSRSARARWFLGAVLVAQLWHPPVAQAHGERAQSSWTRTTVATFFDVKLSQQAVDVGERLTVTGKVKVMETWPYVLGHADLAYLAVSIPGPTLTVNERWINGVFVPGSFEVKPGDFLDFRMELVGRRPGRWHLHPRIDFKGKGPIVGPGFDVQVRRTAAPYRRPVTLLSGKTVDLEHYGLSTVVSWHALWVLIAVAWSAWWLRGSPYRRYVRVRRGEADDALVGPGARRLAMVMGVVTISLVVGGYKYSNSRYQTLPLQVHRDGIPAGDEPAPLATARLAAAEYDSGQTTLRLTLEITNRTDGVVSVDQFVSSTLNFTRSGESAGRWPLTVEPDTPIPPGTHTVTLVMPTPDWRTEKLIPSDNPLTKIGGLVFFGRGPARSWASVAGDIVPDSLGRRAARDAAPRP